MKNPAKRNTSAWRKREKHKHYQKYQNIIHNNLRKETAFMYLHANYKQRRIILPMLLGMLRGLSLQKQYEKFARQ